MLNEKTQEIIRPGNSGRIRPGKGDRVVGIVDLHEVRGLPDFRRSFVPELHHVEIPVRVGDQLRVETVRKTPGARGEVHLDVRQGGRGGSAAGIRMHIGTVPCQEAPVQGKVFPVRVVHDHILHQRPVGQNGTVGVLHLSLDSVLYPHIRSVD